MEETIKNIVERYLIEGQILIDITENFESGFVRIVVDSENSITLDDTALLTRRLLKSDEFIDRYPDGCRIETTTPGLDFPLKNPYQFKKNINKQISICYNNNEKLDSMNCRILSADDNIITVKHNNSDISISYDRIENARLVLSFK